jgi:hypothetical protein
MKDAKIYTVRSSEMGTTMCKVPEFNTCTFNFRSVNFKQNVREYCDITVVKSMLILCVGNVARMRDGKYLKLINQKT